VRAKKASIEAVLLMRLTWSMLTIYRRCLGSFKMLAEEEKRILALTSKAKTSQEMVSMLRREIDRLDSSFARKMTSAPSGSQ